MPNREEFNPGELHGGKDWFDDEKGLDSPDKTTEDVADEDTGEDAFINNSDAKLADEAKIKELEKKLKEEQEWQEAQMKIEAEKRRREEIDSIVTPGTRKKKMKPEEVLAQIPTDAEVEYQKLKRKDQEKKVWIPKESWSLGHDNMKTMPASKIQKNFREKIAKLLGIQKDSGDKYSKDDHLNDLEDAA